MSDDDHDDGHLFALTYMLIFTFSPTLQNMFDMMRLFALKASHSFGVNIATTLGVSLDAHEEREFEDGEHKSRPLVSVRDSDVYVIQSLYADNQQSVNDKLCRLLFFIGALKDSGASRVTAIVPYLCYARKDRKTKPRDPVTTKYVASMFESVGTDRLVTIDVHNLQAYQNAFRCQTEHLEAKKLFASYFHENVKEHEWVVMSPDVGGIKRAEQFKDILAKRTNRKIGVAFMEKQRSMDIVSGETVVGDIEGKNVIIIDDLISSGTTLARAAEACKRLGSGPVYAAATHGAFTSKASEVLQHKSICKVIVTNTIPPLKLSDELLKDKVILIDTAPLFAETIKRLHMSGSLVRLTEEYSLI